MFLDFSKKFVCECEEYSSYKKHVAAPLFRKSFVLTGEVKRAGIRICGLGFYELFVNGQKITKGLLAPYIANPQHFVYYDDYDLKEYLQKGENVIGIMLGDGFQNEKTTAWDFRYNEWNSAPKLALSTVIETEDQEIIFNASDFRCKKGPILFNDLRSGIFYDKRLEEAGWNKSGFLEDDSWHVPLKAKCPKGKPRVCEVEPIVAKKELRPVQIYSGELCGYEGQGPTPIPVEKELTQESAPERTGGWVYDFGENNAGIFRLKIKGTPGQRIDIQCAEMVRNEKPDYSNWTFFPTGHACPDGYMQRDIYVVGSDEEEIFEPMFTYHGYRYLYISGITKEQATEELLTFIVMSSDLKERGAFACSDEMANRIYEIARRSDISNFYYIPTDCPHREKLGWTNDAMSSAEHILYTLEADKSYREWMNNIRASQNEDGQIPQIVPSGTWGYENYNGPSMGGVLFEIPYQMYRYRGDEEIIRENAPAMVKYLKFIDDKRDKNGLLEIGLGDWMVTDKLACLFDAPANYTDSVLAYSLCKKAMKMFKAIGENEMLEYAEQLGKQFYAAIRKHFIEEKICSVKNPCQTSQAMAIYYGIFTDEEKKTAVKKLIDLIHESNDKFTVGSLGMRVLFHVLAQNGHAEMAYQMITGEEFPSYGWYVKQGYTTLPEHFTRGEMAWSESRNHHLHGDVAQWYMRYVAGIQVENYQSVIINPSFIKSLEYATANHILPSGEVRVEWKRNGEEIELKVTCPRNIQCKVMAKNCRVIRYE